MKRKVVRKKPFSKRFVTVGAASALFLLFTSIGVGLAWRSEQNPAFQVPSNELTHLCTFPDYSEKGPGVWFDRTDQPFSDAIYYHDAKGNVTSLFSSGLFSDPSPDRKLEAFGNHAIWVVNHDGTHLRQLTQPATNEDDGSPSWSPDGQWIAFVRDFDIYRIHPDGSGLEKLTTQPLDYPRFKPRSEGWTDLLWSRDQTELAFVADQGSDMDNPSLYVVTIVPSFSGYIPDTYRVTQRGAVQYPLQWSADNWFVSYYRTQDNKDQVRVAKVLGGKQSEVSVNITKKCQALGLF